MKLSANTYITIIIIAGLSLIGYLFTTAPETAPQQLPLILAGIGGLVAVISKQGATDQAVVKSIAVSEHNADQLTVVDKKVTGVHAIVNSQRTAMEEKIAQLQEAIADLREERAATSVEVQHAHGSEQRIISAIESAVTPPPAEGRVQPGEHQ